MNLYEYRGLNLLKDIKSSDLKLFGQQLRYAREELKFSQRDLANALGWSDTHHNGQKRVSSFETGRLAPAQLELKQLCDALEKDEKYFFPGGTPKLKYDRKLRYDRKPYSPRRTYNPDELGIQYDVENEIREKKNEVAKEQ